MEILNVKNLSFSYPDCEHKCLNDISFSAESGELIILSGISGCGKTTLLKMLKPQISPFGKKVGNISFDGTNLNKTDEKLSAFEIGFVMQNPDTQIVSDKVYSELAFGLQNMGLDNNDMQRKICEISDFFGISDWFFNDISTLSGGQKQLLNLASVTVMSPKLLLLDEPTAQLDPISSTRFFDALLRLNRELGITVIVAEHRLNELWDVADKVILMDKGSILLCDTPKNATKTIKKNKLNNRIINALPSAIQIYNALDIKGKCPLNVRDTRQFLSDNFSNDTRCLPHEKYEHRHNAVLELCDVFAKYEKNLPDVLNGTSLKIFEGECVCLLGSNGAGKSTLLKVASGLLKNYAGKIKIDGKKLADYKGNSLYSYVALLPQNPREIFLYQSVLEEFLHVKEQKKYSDDEFEKLKINICEMLGIAPLLSMHPYDLSGGQIQKVALAKLLFLKPRLLLLDEPVKGLDVSAKQELAHIFKKLKQSGITIVIVTHDVEFAAITADRCAMFWGGKVTSIDVTHKFFANNSFYTTSANKISRHMFDNAITCDDVINLCKQNGGGMR